MPHSPCTMSEPIPDMETFEDDLLRAKAELGDGGGQGDEGYNLDLALEAVEEIKVRTR